MVVETTGSVVRSINRKMGGRMPNLLSVNVGLPQEIECCEQGNAHPSHEPTARVLRNRFWAKR